jgi:hypothetical protein
MPPNGWKGDLGEARARKREPTRGAGPGAGAGPWAPRPPPLRPYRYTDVNAGAGGGGRRVAMQAPPSVHRHGPSRPAVRNMRAPHKRIDNTRQQSRQTGFAAGQTYDRTILAFRARAGPRGDGRAPQMLGGHALGPCAFTIQGGPAEGPSGRGWPRQRPGARPRRAGGWEGLVGGASFCSGPWLARELVVPGARLAGAHGSRGSPGGSSWFQGLAWRGSCMDSSCRVRRHCSAVLPSRCEFALSTVATCTRAEGAG